MDNMLVIVVIVLGVIIAGGFLLYFMGDIIMNLASKKNRDDELIRERQLQDAKILRERVDALENADELKKDPTVATILYNGGMVEAYNPEEEEKAEQEAIAGEEEIQEEIAEAEEKSEEVVEDATEEIDETETEEVEEENNEDEEDVADYIARRRQELMEKLARIKEESEEETEEMVDLDEEDDEEVEEEVEENDVEEAEEVKEEAPVVTPADSTIIKTTNFTTEELEAQLAEAQEKLKANEKELRQCKKEYIPLRKVKKTLENDEKKLRRKEALVAKQKVVLYGVNNYADIDEEKAKKLAEDLDLLDGLKLSVQHCHEVMDKNEERYPLLEQIYNLLVNKNAELKAQIKDLQEKLNQTNSDEE